MTPPSLDPLHQFIVHPVLSLKWGNMDLSLTNSAVAMVSAVVMMLVFFFIALRKIDLIPSALQSIAELPFSLVNKMIEESNGKKGYPFLPFISSIFLFVFVGNMIGMFPFAFTFTSQIIINFALAFLIVLVISIYGLIKHGAKFLRVFYPAGVPLWVAPILVPIEIISYLARPMSLAIRLFANMVAGHSMLKIFAYFRVSIGTLGVFPLVVNIGLIGFEFLVAFLQAYVFAMLSCIYLNDALYLH